MSDDVCAQTWLGKHCWRHDITYWGTCPRCVLEATQRPQQPDAAALRITALSKTIDTLMARLECSERRYAGQAGEIADLQAENADLRRRITVLEHGRLEGQRAHNTLASAVQALEDRAS